MKQIFTLTLSLFKKKSLFLASLLILFLACLLLLNKPLSLELKVSPKLKKQAEFSEKSNQILSYLSSYKNQFLWQVDIKQIAQDIEDMSLGLEVYVHRKYPKQLILKLSEKKTALLLLTKKSDFYAISYDGKLGTQKQNQNISHVPILRGSDFEENPSLRKQVLQILKPIPKEGSVFSIENTSEILYDKTHKSFLLYLSNRALVVKLNSPPSKEKIENIEFVLEYLKKEEKKSGLIDARPNKKIIVKKKF